MRPFFLFVAVLFAALPVLAQQPGRKSDREIEIIVQNIATQRNAAQDQLATLAARVQLQTEEIERLKKLCGDRCEPKKEEPKK